MATLYLNFIADVINKVFQNHIETRPSNEAKMGANLSHAIKTHFRFLGGNAMDGEATLYVIDKAEVLGSLLDLDYIWKSPNIFYISNSIRPMHFIPILGNTLNSGEKLS